MCYCPGEGAEESTKQAQTRCLKTSHFVLRVKQRFS